MESIGDRLKKVREDKGYSIEQVSRETNIARKYLRALENEDYADFPGETYLLGFLRNYSEYLGLDSDEMITTYRNIKMQEQPAPIEELLEPQGHRGGPYFLVALILVLLAAGGGAFYKFHYLPSRTQGSEARTASASEKKEEGQDAGKIDAFELKDSVVEKYFKEGSEIIIPVGANSMVSVFLESVGEAVQLTTPSGLMNLKLSVRQTLDLNNDGNADIYVTVNDIDKKGNGAVLRFDRFVNESIEKGKNEALSAGETTPKKEEINIGTTNNSSRKKPVKVILSQEEKEPYILDILFRGYCFVRNVADGGERDEQYFNKGETLRIDASNTVQLWISNAGALSARIAGKDIPFGKPGEVVSYLIEWGKNDESGNYDLKLIPVY